MTRFKTEDVLSVTTGILMGEIGGVSSGTRSSETMSVRDRVPTLEKEIGMLGSDLARWRDEMGLTQPFAAKLLGLSGSTINQYEMAADKPLPRVVALACAALKAKVAPYAATDVELAELDLTRREAMLPPRRGPIPRIVAEKRLAEVLELLDQGMTQAEAGRRLGLNPPVVSRMLARSRKGRSPHFWTERETAIVAEHYPLGGADAVQAFLPHRTVSAIHGKAFKLGLVRDRAAVADSHGEPDEVLE